MTKKSLSSKDSAILKKIHHLAVGEKSAVKAICLRIPDYLLDEVNNKYKKRAGLTRTAWILEAIQKHLEKD